MTLYSLKPAPHSSPYTPVYSSESPSSHTPYRPVPTPRGVIPAIQSLEPLEYYSSIRRPDSNTEEYLKEKAREQWAISKQTYRTLPLIEPRPKVRRDWPTGSYMRHMEGPSWHDVPRTIIKPSPQKLQNVMNRYGQRVQQNNPGVVHLQYNTPINIYSDDNVANTLTPRPVSPAPPQLRGGMARPARPRSMPPQMLTPIDHRNQMQTPIHVDITHSPTYQLLLEEEESREYRHNHNIFDSNMSSDQSIGPPSGQSQRHSHSHSYSPIGLHSPAYPTQTPYFKSLMNSLLPNPGV